MHRSRRSFIGSCLLVAMVTSTAASAQASEDRDQYGGWTGRKFEATGHFRLEKAPDRWWLVTPEGNAYLIHGMDHCGLDVVNQPYNREHWRKQLGWPKDATRAQQLRLFYKKKVAVDRGYLSFNCLYSHQIPGNVERVVPYIPRARTLDIEYWRTWRVFSEENFLDVFEEDFVHRCEQTAQRLVTWGLAMDPWIVGYGLTDSPVLTIKMAMPHRQGFFTKPLPGTTTWPVRLRNLGADAPGKQAYIALMKERYEGNIGKFNACYNTAFESWDALAAAEKWRMHTDPSGNMHEERDNHVFLLRILDKAWGTQVRMIRKYDPNHLIFGDTLNLNEPISDDIIRIYVKHFPIITYQYYGATPEDHLAVMDRFRRVAPDVPMFSADSCWSVCDPPRMPDTLGPQCANHTVRAQRFNEVYRAAFARPDFIGWGWCGWMDKWESAEPIMQHSGLQDVFGNWNQPIADHMSQFGKEMYQIAQP